MTARVDAAPALRARGAMLTHVGRVRSSNEDSVVFVSSPEERSSDQWGTLALVADGMGGHAAGEVASALAAEVVRRIYCGSSLPVPETLRMAFEAANTAVIEHADAHPECRGMGTTCTAVAMVGGKLYLAHAGDSRAYLLRGDVLTQLSEDHSLNAQLVREGVMTKEEAETSPNGNVIVKALGSRAELDPAVWSEGLPLADGDRVLLCSDGLSNLVSDSEIAAVLQRLPPTDACDALVEQALAAGGYDNISVGVFAIEAPAASDRAGADRGGSARTTRRIVPQEILAEDSDARGATRRIKL
ncbi:protein phosphatase 2C domain-containing protein [Xanthobacter oligotrophicus]|uniref:protein phosphatase 2C domain-containing protein n=1 Tax=Xanthobacter oligotrophicus TaxID=2607286 RepID=UPI0011F302F4|nr:PP2C family serine/threonine-protein phosphatase [Xanthobacter oligotrophicus]MCG5237815.1 protein phosphatase 2C domain-containing protein [Xanthobacter oligotrophicus]